MRLEVGTRQVLAGRLAPALVAFSLLGLTQCTPAEPGAPSPTATSPAPTSPAPTSPPPGSTESPRTLTAANLPKARELPVPIGDGKVSVSTRNARSLDAVTICLQAPVSALGATATEIRSYRSRTLKGRPSFPSALLDRQPDSYAVALQFPDPTAAMTAKSTVETWVVGCGVGDKVPAGIKVVDGGFEWTPVGNHTGEPPVAEVAEAAEVAYRRAGLKAGTSVFESVGLTVVGDRMMITVHLFATDESPFTTNIDDDEAGFAHPQIGLVQAAAKALRR